MWTDIYTSESNDFVIQNYNQLGKFESHLVQKVKIFLEKMSEWSFYTKYYRFVIIVVIFINIHNMFSIKQRNTWTKNNIYIDSKIYIF